MHAEGPVEVRKGPLEVAAVVVLDPSGEGKHGGLPATWRPLTEDVGVVWCRLPAIRAAGEEAVEGRADEALPAAAFATAANVLVLTGAATATDGVAALLRY